MSLQIPMCPVQSTPECIKNMDHMEQMHRKYLYGKCDWNFNKLQYSTSQRNDIRTQVYRLFIP